MPSQRIHEGELTIDNRASPGVPIEMVRAARAAGKWVPEAGEGALFESATITCAHCGSVVILNPDRTRPRSYCRRCDRYICDGCAALGECVPFEKILLDTADAIYHKHGG